MEAQPDLVRQMAAAFTAGATPVDAFLRGVCHHMADRLRCNRVNVWRFEGPPGLRALRCVSMHDARPTRSGCPRPDLALPELVEPQYRDYLAALADQGYIESADTWNDRRLATLLPHYLRPLDVRSLLDVGFSVNGCTVGVLSCEHTGELRRWVPADVAALRRAGPVISLALAKCEEWEAHFPEEMPVTRS